MKSNYTNLVTGLYRDQVKGDKGVRVRTVEGASVQHPISIRSASDGTRWQSGGSMLHRIAIALLMILTLGVGQMWGKLILVDMGSAPNWYDNAHIHYYSGSDKYVALESTGITNIYKATIPDSHGNGWRLCRYVSGSRYNDGDWISDSSSDNKKFTYGGSSASTIVGLVKGGYIYFDNSSTGWTGNIQFVIGRGTSSGYSRTYEMTQLTGTKIWYVNLGGKDNHEWADATYYGFIASTDKFGDGSWGSNNLNNATKYTAAYTSPYSLDDGSTYWCVPSGTSNGSSFSITYKSGGYGGIPTNTMTISVRTKITGGSYGSSYNSPTTVTMQTRYLSNNGTSSTQSASVSTSAKSNTKADVTTGEVNFSYTALAADAQWVFDGWGTTNSTVSSTNSTYRIDAGSAASKTATTIYAFFTRKPVLTVNCGSNGTSASGSATNNAKTSYNISATPADGYQFKEWTVSSGSVTFGSSTSASTTATISADATITATFEEKTGGMITLNAGTGGEVSTDNTTWGSTKYITDITTATDKNIYARASTGYTFNTWTKSSGSGTIKTNAASGVFTTVAYEDATVTASFSEIMSSLSTSCHYDVGNPSYSAPSVSGSATTVGYATTRSITAANPSTGYTFAGWTLTNCTRTDGGAATAKTITIRSNGDGAAATVVANYTEDLSSPWIVTGGNKIVTTGTTWRTTADANNKMLKKTGHSTESVVYYTVNVDAANQGESNSNYQFKIYNTSTSTYYGLEASGQYYLMRDQDNGVARELDSDGANIELRADGAGEYEIKVDYSSSPTTITVTFPVVGNYTTTLAAGAHGSVENAGSITLHSTPPTTITANPEPGYRFYRWVVTGSCSVANTSSATTTATATASGGTITAEFTNSGFVYFDRSAVNGVWSGDKVYMTCLNSSDLTWSGSNGSLVVKNWVNDAVHNVEMSRIPNTNIYYFDCTGYLPSKILFTDKSHPHGGGENYYTLYAMGAVVEYENVDLGYDNMFVVENYTWQSKNNTGYFDGYWMKYNETNSGLELQIFTSGNAAVSGNPFAFTTTRAGDREFTTTVTLSATTSYKFKVKGYNGRWYGNSGTMTNTNCTGWDFLDRDGGDCFFTSTGAGTYTFTLSCTNTGRLKVSMKFPLAVNDYRVVYNGKIKSTDGSGHPHPSDFIRYLSTTGTQTDTLSFYVTGSDWNLQLQQCTSISPSITWTNRNSAVSSSSLCSPAQGTHLFKVEQTYDGSSRTVSICYLEPYSGDYYIRTDVTGGGWEGYKTTPDSKMEYSDFSKEHSGYDYYHCHWAPTNKNIRFCIANDYSSSITDTLINGVSPFNWEFLPYQASVRFMYNSETNVIGRAYLNGSNEEGEATYLWLQGTSAGTSRILNTSGSTFTDNKVKFGDDGNWVYSIDIKAEEGARVKLVSNYRFNSADHLQYFKGTSADWSDASTEVILGGSATTTSHLIRIVYDFKTNHLLSAWLADGNDISSSKAIQTSVMVVREHQEDAKQITFTGTGKLTDVDTVYCVMQFNKWTTNNKSKTEPHNTLTGGAALSIYERALYWVSFPFDVNLNDVFGFGTYGEHWIMEYYDGKGRAANGFWAESDVNWKYIEADQKKNYVLNAFEGYVLCLNLDAMAENSKVWDYVDNVSLYFPSSKAVGSIVKQDTTITIDQTGYECTIDRSGESNGLGGTLGASYDRTKRDSYWHCIGTPSFANNTHSYATTFSKVDGDDYYYPNSWTADNLPFYYAWNPATNALSPQRAGSSMTFKAMNSYLVQYSKSTMAWSSTVVTPKPKSVVARQKAKAEDIHFAEFNIHLLSGEQDIDHTYVRLTDNEEVTAGFEFGHDLTKAFNPGANIYTLVEDVEVAGNSLPLNLNETTTVPVGVKITTAGNYTISIPDGTSGIGVTLVDSETGLRTSLSALDYTTYLEAGDYDGRFSLEISPIHTTPTDIPVTNEEKADASRVRKVLIDGQLFIIRDGRIYNAAGMEVR